MRYPLRFSGVGRAMAAIGIGAKNSYAEITPSAIEVRMGWAFRATVARSAVLTVADDHDRVWGWGAHGWRGRWLVNGSSTGLVRLDIDPPAQARVLGWPLRLTVLRVSLDDPSGFIEALS